MTATFQYAQILQGQQKYSEAIAAWKGYLANFPNGPQSADAQRAILDTELLMAADHDSRGRYLEARAAWKEFVSQNPLDERVPGLLFQLGESYLAEKKYDDAIAAWGPLTMKYPATEPAAHAQFLTASLHENEKGDPATAIEQFRKIAVEPWRTQALERVAVMEARALVVSTPRAYRTGETARLKILTRNLEKLTFTAYKLNAEAYFRKKQGLANVESLDIGLVAPDAEWTVEVPGYAKYKPIDHSYELKTLEQPGVYVIKVTDQKYLQATTLVLASDLDAIVKTSRDQMLVFAQDMKTGKGRPGARVLICDAGSVVLEARTGPDGVLLHNWSPAREANHRLSYLVVDGGHVAGSGLGVPQKLAQGLTPRAYLYTDRPAYRPGQQVAVRGVIREVHDGQYTHVPGAVYRFEVADSRGRQLIARSITLSDFGTFHETLPIDAGAPVGTYRLHVFQPGKSNFAGSFEVQSYQLEPIDLSFNLKQTVYYRGETVEADVVARYQYGAAVANRPIEVTLPDQRVLTAATDAMGRFHVSFPTEGFAEEQALRLVARLPQDNVAAAASVLLAVRGFDIELHTNRDVYLDGESFQVQVGTEDAQGNPIGRRLNATLIKRISQAGRVTEREAQRKTLQTDPKLGQATVTFRVDDAQGGDYVLRLAGVDRFANQILAERAITISGKADETKLRILAERQRYKMGEEASVNLHSRGRAGTALLTWEADRILTYRLVTIKDGDNPVAWVVDGPQFPNFTLTAARMSENHFDEAKLDIQVERELKVSVTPTRPEVGPGEEVELEITAADQLDRPAAAELSIAMIDRSLLRLYGDRLRPIDAFFYDQTRTGAFATEATNTFRYAPATVAVSRAVVDEAERIAAIESNSAGRPNVRELLQKQVTFGYETPANQPAAAGAADFAGVAPPGAAPTPAEARPMRAVPGNGGMGGMMGGMGRMGQATGSKRRGINRDTYYDPSKAQAPAKAGRMGDLEAGDTRSEAVENVHMLGLRFQTGVSERTELGSRLRRGIGPARSIRRDRVLESARGHRQRR